MTWHKNITTEKGIHGIVAFNYANTTERTSATGLTSVDLHKVAFQSDDNSFWILTSISPLTWETLGSGSGGTLTSPTLSQDGYIAIADSGDLVYLSGTNNGDVLTWNSSTNSWEPQVNISGITVKRNDVIIGSQPAINFIQGSNVSLSISNDTINQEIDVTISATGDGGAAVGTLSQVLANGNTTDGYDIIITPGDVISGMGAAVSIIDGLNLNNYNIINVGTIDGYNLENQFQSITNHITNVNNPHLTSIANIGSGTLSQLNSAVSDADLVSTTRLIAAGNGLTGGGDLSADRTINIAAADSSITVNADSIQVGVISDTQHGSRNGGTLHSVATTSVAGFMSSTDKTKLDNVNFDGYALLDGSRDFTGSLNIGGFNITNVNLVDGYNLENEFQRLTNHTSNVNNPHNTSIANIGSGTLSQLNLAISDADVVPTVRNISAGNGLTGGGDLSIDRTINIASADSSITVNADSIQVGVISDIQHGTKNGGTLHSVATTSSAGFMSSSDKIKIDDINLDGYALLDGSRPFTGSLNLSGFDINNVGIIDGYNLENQFSIINSHIINTSNPHSTSIANIGSGTLAQLNSAISDADVVSAARVITAGNGLTGGGDLSIDRTINIAAADSSITVNADSIQVGTISNIQHGNLSGGSLHSIATTSIDGFMSASDKLRLDGINLDGYASLTHATRHENGGLDEINVAGLSGVLADNQRIGVRRNDVAIGSQPTLNFIQGSNVSLSISNDTGNNEIDITISATSGEGGVAGNLSQVLANGNTTDGYDIVVSIGDIISGSGTPISIMDGLNLNNYNITNVNLIDGYNLENEFQRLTNHTSNINNPHATSIANIGLGTLAQLNSAISDADVTPTTRLIIAGNGLTGGGDFSSDRTINIAAADSSITVNADSIQVGTINGSQHGNLSGGSLHSIVTTSIDGFMSSTDKVKLDNINLDGYASITHAARHQNNGADEINVAGLSGVLADDQRINVKRNDVVIGSQSSLNFIQGSNISLSVFNDVANNEIDITVSSTSSGTLSQVLSNGNITDGYNIVVSAGDLISGSGSPISIIDGLNLNNYNITNVNLVDGYNLENEFQRLTNHITNANNPHLTSIANIGSGTLTQLNSAILDTDVVPTTITLTAGNGLTGGGDLSTNRTFNIAAADTSITVNADSIQVGVISDTQHGNRGGGTLHATATTSVAGFISAADKTKLDGIQTGAQVNPNIWSVISDGTNTASPATTSDTIRFRSANTILTTTIGSNDPTYGDNLLLTVNQGNIDHGSISGLSDDDHTQYLLANGTRTLTGSLNVGGFNITNVGTVDGYNLENEFQRLTNHITNINNPHSTSIANIESGTLAQLNAAISDTDVVSITRTLTAGNGFTGGGDLSTDRTFNIAAADGSITVNADSIQVGVVSDTQHGSRSGGTLHSTATTSVAGFMSSTDKTKLDLFNTVATQGSVMYYNGSSWLGLTAGTDGYVLTTHGSSANPTWEGSSFSNNLQIVESLGESTTTSTTYQTKLSLTTPALTGDYIVSWSCGIGKTVGSGTVFCRVYNSTNSVAISNEWNRDPLTNNYVLDFSGFAKVTFSGASKTFDLQYKSGGGNTALIRMARLAIWRMA